MPSHVRRPSFVLASLLLLTLCFMAWTTSALAQHLLVLNKRDATASVLDAATGRTVATIDVGVGPHEAATLPDGKRVVVANYGTSEPGSTLSVLDLRTLKVVETIDLAPYHRPHGLAFLPNGNLLVTAEEEKKLLVVDVDEGSVLHAIGTDQNVSHMVAAAPDGKRAYVTNIGSGSLTVIDLEKNVLVKNMPTGLGAEGIAVHPDGSEVWVANRAMDTVTIVDAATLEIVETFQCGRFPIRAAFLPDGKHVLIPCAATNDVAVIDAASRKELRRVHIGEVDLFSEEERASGNVQELFQKSSVPIGVLPTPDGQRAFIASQNGSIISVIDLTAWKVVDRFQAGDGPDGMAWVPAVSGGPAGR